MIDGHVEVKIEWCDPAAQARYDELEKRRGFALRAIVSAFPAGHKGAETMAVNMTAPLTREMAKLRAAGTRPVLYIAGWQCR